MAGPHHPVSHVPVFERPRGQAADLRPERSPVLYRVPDPRAVHGAAGGPSLCRGAAAHSHGGEGVPADGHGLRRLRRRDAPAVPHHGDHHPGGHRRHGGDGHLLPPGGSGVCGGQRALRVRRQRRPHPLGRGGVAECAQAPAPDGVRHGRHPGRPGGSGGGERLEAEGEEKRVRLHGGPDALFHGHVHRRGQRHRAPGDALGVCDLQRSPAVYGLPVADRQKRRRPTGGPGGFYGGRLLFCSHSAGGTVLPGQLRESVFLERPGGGQLPGGCDLGRVRR